MNQIKRLIEIWEQKRMEGKGKYGDSGRKRLQTSSSSHRHLFLMQVRVHRQKLLMVFRKRQRERVTAVKVFVTTVKSNRKRPKIIWSFSSQNQHSMQHIKKIIFKPLQLQSVAIALIQSDQYTKFEVRSKGDNREQIRIPPHLHIHWQPHDGPKFSYAFYFNLCRQRYENCYLNMRVRICM